MTDFDGKFHACHTASGLRIYGDDVDFLAHKGFRNIPQKPLPIARFDDEIGGKQMAGLAAPFRFNHTLRMHRLHVRKIGAIGTVDRYALAARHKAHDRVRRCRLAATGYLRHQPVNADNQDAFVSNSLGFGLLDGHFIRRLIARQGFAAHGRLELAQAKIAARQAGKQIVRFGEPELLRQFIELDVRAAHPLQLARQNSASLSQRLFVFARGKPLTHLDARPMRQQVTERRIEPVTRRPALFGGNDFDPLAGFQRRIERHQGAVDFGAAATMSQVSMDTVGKIDRRCAAR